MCVFVFVIACACACVNVCLSRMCITCTHKQENMKTISTFEICYARFICGIRYVGTKADVGSLIIPDVNM